MFKKSLPISLIILTVLFGASLAEAAPMTFTVNTVNDISDPSPDGICDDGSGNCSLREAVQEANANPGEDTVRFASCGSPVCVYLLSLGGVDEDDAATGDLDVNDDLIVIGNGRGVTVVDGDAQDRVFELYTDPADPAIQVSLSGLTIRNGDATLGANRQGGGVSFGADNTENIFIFDEIEIAGNLADEAGGVFLGLGTSTWTNCHILGNTAAGALSVNGGGGVGIINGSHSFTDCVVDGNTATRGGGMTLSSQVELDRVVLSRNRAISADPFEGTGGGLYGAGGDPPISIRDSILRENESSHDGGGARIFGAFQISGTTFQDNISLNGNGGGLAFPEGALGMVNCTVSGNQAALSGGGIAMVTEEMDADFKLGLNPNTLLDMKNLTIAENSAQEGGGVFRSGDFGNIQMANTIIAQNTSANCAGDLISLGHNLSDDDTCGLVSEGDLPNRNPALGPLADNGGPTPTHYLLAGSPAVDGASDCPPPDVDQRGFPRPQGLACDIGAVEVGCGDSIVQGSEECDDGNASDGDGCDAECRLEAVPGGPGALLEGSGCGLTPSARAPSSKAFAFWIFAGLGLGLFLSLRFVPRKP